MEQEASLRNHLVKLLTGGEAHVTFEAAIKDLPAELRGKIPGEGEHSPWMLLEHLRLAQSDILDFSRNPDYKEKKWPEEYWPASAAPEQAEDWDKSVAAFREDLKAMCTLVEDPATDLFAPISHGTGQTVLREALLVADHNAYHVGQIVTVRKLLGAW